MDSKAVALNYLAAFASGDADTVAACVTHDFVNEQVGELGTGCQGADTYRQRLRQFLQDFEGLYYTVQSAISEGDRVAVVYQMHFAHGPQNIDIPGVMIIQVRDGLVAHRADYWDGLTYQKFTS